MSIRSRVSLANIVRHILLYGSTDGIRGHSADDRFGNAARQDGQADQSEEQVEPFPQHRCVVMPEEDVDAPQDSEGVHETAQCPAEAIDDATFPVQVGKQLEAGARYHADENPRHKADDKAPHISMRGPEHVEWSKDKCHERVWRCERPDQEAEQAGERPHTGARAGAEKDGRDDDGDHAERRDDRPHRRKGAERCKADQSLNSEKHGELGQSDSFSFKRCFHAKPP